MTWTFWVGPYISLTEQEWQRKLHKKETEAGVMWCAGDNQGIKGQVGCGALSFDRATSCAGCGAPTAPPDLRNYISTPKGVEVPEPAEVSLGVLAGVNEILSGVACNQAGTLTFTHGDALDVRKLYGLKRSGVEMWTELVRAACAAHNRGISDGRAYKEAKRAR